MPSQEIQDATKRTEVIRSGSPNWSEHWPLTKS